MQEVLAYSTLVTTVGLVLSRPRIGASFRFGPGSAGLAGVLLLLALGVVRLADLALTLAVLWRPMLGIAAIMVTTAVAERLGVLAFMTAQVEARARGRSGRLFLLVYLLSAITAAVMNNDAAVLIMTPVVVSLVRRVFPARPELVLPFAFAVFMAAGVAPLQVSNPMNLVVATRMGIGYGAYALHLVPVWLVGAALTFVLLRWLFRRELADDAGAARAPSAPPPPLARAPRRMLWLLAGSLLAYPMVSALGGPVWMVAVAAAAAALWLARAHVGGARLAPFVRGAIAWEVLVFMAAAFLIALGLRQVGLVDRLAEAYRGAGSGTVGACSALGSALLNNHPMSHLNMLALAGQPGAFDATLAALVGGDLGPRLFPLGSLAGLLWLESLRRQGIDLSVGRFIVVGAVATVPVLVVSLALLALL